MLADTAVNVEQSNEAGGVAVCMACGAVEDMQTGSIGSFAGICGDVRFKVRIWSQVWKSDAVEAWLEAVRGN